MELLGNKLKYWGEKTVAGYISLATSFNKAFYTQSDLTQLYNNKEGEVVVMILGINPGSEDTYEGQKEKKGWDLNGKDMDVDHFMRGNFFIQDDGTTSWQHRHTWAYWHRLRGFFSLCESNPLDEETRFVLSNMCHFNTPKANEVPAKIFNATKPHAIELIDLIKPQRIVFLSGKNTLGKLGVKRDFKEMNVNVFVGEYQGIPCIATPHPSAYLTSAERLYIKQTMKEFMEYGDVKTMFAQHDTMPLAQTRKYTKDDRQEDAKKVLSALEGDLLKGNGLWKYKAYKSYCNGAFEVYAPAVEEAHITIRFRDKEDGNKAVIDLDGDFAIGEDANSFKIYWPFKAQLCEQGSYLEIVRATIEQLKVAFHEE